MKKKSYKKYFNATLAATVAATGVAVVAPNTTNASTSFSDVPSTYNFYNEVTNLSERGIIKGFGDGTFRPGDNVTRGQVAKIIAGALGLDTKNVKNPGFTDIPTTHQYYGAIAALANAGIISGYEDDTYRPGEPVQRNHMAKIIAGAFNLQATQGYTTPLTDVRSDYKNYISALHEYGVTTGKTATTFDGSSYVTRGQLAAFVVRAENVNSTVIKGEITTIVGDTLTIGKDTYKISSKLQSLLNVENLTALKGAKIEATVTNDEIVTLNALTIVAEGTAENPVVLKGTSNPVASLNNVAALQPFMLEATLTIDTPYSAIQNINAKKVIVSNKVKDIELNETIQELVINSGASATIQGSASINVVQVNSENALKFDVNGTVEQFNFNVEKATLTLGSNVKVSKISTNGADIKSLISNYSSVQNNINSVNGSTPTKTSTSGGSSSGSSSSSTKQVTGIINEVGSTVKINNTSYSVDASVASLFAASNNSVLTSADVSVVVQNNKIVKVTALTLNNSGTLSGGNSKIEGNLTIDADGVILKELIVEGDVLLTDKVKESINFEKVSISGKVTTPEEIVAAKVPKSMVASLSPFALLENPVTRLKITFKDSTVAYVEIKKIDTILSATGATQISTVALQSNGSIYADPDVILPNLKIEKGVTNIELNASIASVEIESNDDIEISGNGNFDKVLVKTDKEVMLNTTGTIKQLGSEKANITLGSTVKVGQTTNLAGESKDAEEVVSNLDEVQENVNIPIDEEDEEEFVAAKLIPVENRFGYATLHVLNAGDDTIKYRFVPEGSSDISEVKGKKVPSDTITYNGEPFIAWFVNDIEVYKVDKNGIVIDAYRISAWTNNGIDLDSFEVKDNKIIYKTVYARPDLTTEFIYFINGTNSFRPENIESYEWKEVDGIPTLEIPLPTSFRYDDTKLGNLFISLEGQEITGVQHQSGLSSSQTIGDRTNEDNTKLQALYELSNISGVTKDSEYGHGLYFALEVLLVNYAYEEVPVTDLQGNELFKEHKSLVSSIDYIFDEYIQNAKEQLYSSGEEVKAMVIEVNEKHADVLTKLKSAEDAVYALLVEDFYDFDLEERLVDGVTLEQINIARALVEELDDSISTKSTLLRYVEMAEEVFNLIHGELTETPIEKFKKHFELLLAKNVTEITLEDEFEIESALKTFNYLTNEEQEEATADKKLLTVFLEQIAKLKIEEVDGDFTISSGEIEVNNDYWTQVTFSFENEITEQHLFVIRPNSEASEWPSSSNDNDIYTISSSENNLQTFDYYFNLDSKWYKFTLKNVAGLITIDKIEEVSSLNYLKNKLEVMLNLNGIPVEQVNDMTKITSLEEYLDNNDDEYGVLAGINYSVDIEAVQGEPVAVITLTKEGNSEKIYVNNTVFKDEVGPYLIGNPIVNITTGDTITFTFSESLHVKNGETIELADTGELYEDVFSLENNEGDNVDGLSFTLNDDRTILTVDLSDISGGQYTLIYNPSIIQFYDEVGNEMPIFNAN